MEEKLDSIKDRIKRSGKIETSVREHFIDLLDKESFKSKNVLSVSCGDGVWDHIFFSKSNNCTIVATDIVSNPVSVKDIKMLKKNGKWSFKKVLPDKQLPFTDKLYDVIYHFDVIEHVNKPIIFLAEQFRLLKPGGKIICVTPNLLRPANIIKLLCGNLKFPHKIGYKKEIGDYIHVHEFTSWELESIAKEIGYTNVKTDMIYFGVPGLNITISKYPKTFSQLSHYLFITAQKPR
jgi:2-polyprenyl-3-methyl-5-hydroxy-6-metoxy-1,4-benzoquinol methylase